MCEEFFIVLIILCLHIRTLNKVNYLGIYGDICDTVNAVLYLTEGDYINAGLSALSIVPGADDFSKIGKSSKVLGNGKVRRIEI